MCQFTIGSLLKQLESGAKKNADLLDMNVCYSEFGSIEPCSSILLKGESCVIDGCIAEAQFTVSDIILALRQFVKEDESARDFPIFHVEFGGLEKTDNITIRTINDENVLCLS